MKPPEIREIGIEELRIKELDLTKELFNLRIQNSTGHLENPSRINLLKKDIARVKTVIREKEKGTGF
ncbi:MAG: 50S ribosomal protein L29 [Thermodesulfobacteriota bacterium]